MTPAQTILDHLLTAPTGADPVADLEGWWATHRRRLPEWSHAFDAGVAGGFAAPNVAWAFAAGYHAATSYLFGTNALAALCITEAAGAHPSTLACHIAEENGELRLRGTKTMVTFGARADKMLILAHRGLDDDGRKRFVMVEIPRGARGADFAVLPPFPFVPEVPHAAVRLDVGIDASQLLPDDGYARYARPFRTVEDLRVQAAVTAYLLRLLRSIEGPRDQVEALVAHVATLRQLAASLPVSPSVHVALAGATRRLEGVVDDVTTALAEGGLAPGVLEAWLRDRRLLEVAERVRARRRERAWARLGP